MQDIKPKDFEKRVGRFLQRQFKQTFKETGLKIGANKCHKFDLVSEDGSIVVECKKYKWTKGGNIPSAKFSTALEAVLYFSRISAFHKILVFFEDVQDGKSLVDEFVKKYNDILDDIEVWAYILSENESNDEVRVVRKAKQTWKPILQVC